MDYLNINDLILINQYAQGVINQDAINNWFANYNEEEKKLILKIIWQLAIQAKITEDDIVNVINIYKDKNISTPSAMLLSKKNSFIKNGYNLARLNGVQLNRALLLVLDCFVYANQKRKKMNVQRNAIIGGIWICRMKQ